MQVYHLNYCPLYHKWEMWPTDYRYNKELNEVYHTPAKDWGTTQYYENYSIEIESIDPIDAITSGMKSIMSKVEQHSKGRK